jgi:hypothetical protein
MVILWFWTSSFLCFQLLVMMFLSFWTSSTPFSTQDWSRWSSCDLEPLRPSSFIFATFSHDVPIIILNPLSLLLVPNHGVHLWFWIPSYFVFPTPGHNGPLVILNPLILFNFNFWSWSCSSCDFEPILPLCFQFMVIMHPLVISTPSSSLFLAPSCDFFCNFQTPS